MKHAPLVFGTPEHAEWLADKIVAFGDYAKEAAQVLRQQAALQRELLEALQRMCKSFPTDADMVEAGWDPPEVSEACSAYDAARAAISKATGEKKT